ncbi:hypothetical protein XELAEV_18041968mg [Xenopus laevis]|uniref:Uncharacterized protein n=1 Tax=Xenopus laevis TaxID=8355 RepID=A0A974C346_XENLA|nr:hypothetical protein XELAEV_18041968mg [Xenopus laevis]
MKGPLEPLRQNVTNPHLGSIDLQNKQPGRICQVLLNFWLDTFWPGEDPVGLLAICYPASAAPAQLQPDWHVWTLQPSCCLISCNQPIRADSALFKVNPPNTPCQSIVSQTSSVALSLAKGFSFCLLALFCPTLYLSSLYFLVLFLSVVTLLILPSPVLIFALSILFCSAPNPV